MPISWHEENLVNFKATTDRYHKELVKLQLKVKQYDAEIAFPEQFVKIQNLQSEINKVRTGDGANFLRFRSGPRKGERMSLAELPEGRGNMKEEPNFSCSFFCQMAEDEIQPKA